jgi:hypothetical protein
MMNYVPKCVKEEGSKWSGSMELEQPLFTTQCELIAMSKMDVMGGASQMNNSDSLLAMSKIIVETKKFYKGVALKYEDQEFKSFDDLNASKSLGGPILMEVASMYLGSDDRLGK